MIVVTVFLLSALLATVSAQFCPTGYEDLNQGTPCSNDAFCARFDPRYKCVRGFCCKSKGFCAPNEISISNVCYPIAGVGGACVHSAQCQPAGVTCQNGVCVAGAQYDGPYCINPMQQAEKVNGVIKNCAQTPCSKGFKCEYNPSYGQYICCGQYDSNYDYNYGKVRMYPGTSRPLRCFDKHHCLWVDTPNCVFSHRYNQKVCCSTFYC